MTTLALVLLASGCSQPAEEKRAFQVPSALCGTPVPVELLSPALPASGERIEEERKDGDGYFTCKVVVDGKSALTARWEWMKAGKTARSVAYDNPYRDLADVESEDKRYVYSGVGGVSRVTCEPVVAHRKGQAELFATIALSDREAPAPEMKKLLLAYAEALSDSSECVQK